MPVWLNEGLAVHAEGQGSWTSPGSLKNAVAKNTLISVRSLASPFSANSDLAFQGYCESFSIVDFLISSYGQDKILESLDAFKQGNTYDDALQKVYGFDSDGLNVLWQKYLRSKLL